jgi:hypothetical protein
MSELAVVATATVVVAFFFGGLSSLTYTCNYKKSVKIGNKHTRNKYAATQVYVNTTYRHFLRLKNLNLHIYKTVKRSAVKMDFQQKSGCWKNNKHRHRTHHTLTKREQE